MDYQERRSTLPADITGVTPAEIALEIVRLQATGEIDTVTADSMLASVERATQITDIAEILKRLKALEDKQ